MNAMNTNNRQQLETKAWYYERWMFARGRTGQLVLRGGRLKFVTASAGTAVNNWYEKLGKADETIFDVALADVDAISYNWLTAGLTVALKTKRHLVSFSGSPSGNHIEDAGTLITAIANLNRWRTALQKAHPENSRREAGRGSYRR